MRKLALFLALPVLLLASGCASVIEGTSQTLSFDSDPKGAHCVLEREGLTIGSLTTPSGVVVRKSKHDIHVTCEKEGYHDASAVITSDVEGATAGNIIFGLLGGPVGWIIDSASGADNYYEEFLRVVLRPVEPAPGAPAPASAPTDGGPAPPGESYGVVLASYSNEEVAKAMWPDFVVRYPVLGSAEPLIRQTENEGGGFRYDLYGSGLSVAQAEQACEIIKAEGEFCRATAL